MLNQEKHRPLLATGDKGDVHKELKAPRVGINISQPRKATCRIFSGISEDYCCVNRLMILPTKRFPNP